MNYQHQLDKVKHSVHHFFNNKNLSQLCYHNLLHTESVVGNAARLARHYGLDERETFIVQTAAWYHDTGYLNGETAGHEERGAELAAAFLRSEGVGEEIIEKVKKCILATIWPQNPSDLLEQIVCDADVYHLGTPEFSEWNKLVRKEAEQKAGHKIDKAKWRESTIRLLETHQFQTDYCREHLNKQKQKNLAKLKEKQADTPVEEDVSIELKEPEIQLENIGEAKKPKSDRPDKGIETMFRISSNNHQRLSDMADNKAHIMITTTSIIISVLLSVLIRRLEDNAYLIFPTTLLLAVCLVTMVFSILATRPTIPHGTFSQEDIDNKSVNLLFFGNFYRMSYQDYAGGMQRLMNDREFLYGSLTKDVYSQGVVLGKKYRLLRIGYNVFMFGIIVSVISFVVASLLFEH
ncbi:Pycsar system effector family protein [Dyadobacter crusticola]|uniref:Pycsar system effector family protein n=1 Tax=Dyadobacter crusticola TaxID=292407 RepID=UPI0004E18D2E|nr:Pycsar system effector family protein [Dyadobacter crusticola]